MLVVKETIDRLQRLSSAIQQVSAQDRYLKALTFIDKDDDGEDISSAFRVYAVSMVRREYKGASDALCEQLGVSIFVRRNAFLYLRRHQRKLARQRAEGVMAPIQAPVLEQKATFHSQDRLGSFKSKNLLFSSKVKAKSSKSAALSRTTVPVIPKGGLNAKLLQRLAEAPQPSVAGSGSSVLVKDVDLVYPAPPVLEKHMNECLCPYCFEPLQKSIITVDRRWR